MKTIVVTGASGLVGSHLLPLLVPDHEIHVLAREPLSQTAGNIHHYAADLNGAFRTDMLPRRVDAVIHLAQSDHFRDFPDKAPDIFAVNVAALLRLLDYARRAGARSFVSASSGGVYGTGERGLSEDISIPASGNLGFYLSTKLCGEIIADNYVPFMNVAVLRLFFAYGQGQKRSMLIPRLADNIRDGRPIQLQGRDGICINPINARDAARATFAALSLEKSATINVAGPDILSLRELGCAIGRAIGRKPTFEMDEREVPPNLVADIDRMTELLGAPTIRFADGLADLL